MSLSNMGVMNAGKAITDCLREDVLSPALWMVKEGKSIIAGVRRRSSPGIMDV